MTNTPDREWREAAAMIVMLSFIDAAKDDLLGAQYAVACKTADAIAALPVAEGGRGSLHRPAGAVRQTKLADPTALLPCPFCNGSAHVHKRVSGIGRPMAAGWQVYCGECHNGTSDNFEGAEFATAAWNRRSGDRACSHVWSSPEKSAPPCRCLKCGAPKVVHMPDYGSQTPVASDGEGSSAGAIPTEQKPGIETEVVERLRGAVTASGGIDLRDPDLLISAADLIQRITGERDEERGKAAFNRAVLKGHRDRAELAEAKVTELGEALREALSWHEAQAKALSKEPPRADLQWRRLNHQEEIERITQSLATSNASQGEGDEEHSHSASLRLLEDPMPRGGE